jgi:chitinase
MSMIMHTFKITSVFLLISLILAPFSVSAATSRSKSEKPWLITYYVGYQNGYLKPKDVDFSLMTHVVVGGVGVNADGTLDEHWHLENGDGHTMAKDIAKYADKKKVKKLIWLGGPNEEDKFYSATSDENRKKFVKNIITLIDELGYDGVDIDWEPVRAKDEPRLLSLVKDLRKADKNLIITVPVNWVTSSIIGSKDLSVYKKMSPYVDKMFIMSYSMAGAWPGWNSWHGGALRGEGGNTPSSIDSSVNAYLDAGVPNGKLGIGVGTYATCWEYPVKKPNQTLPTSFNSRDTHVMSMRTMMDEYYKRTYEKWDSKAKVPYLSFKKKQGDFECGYISYENTRSMKEKVAYVKKNKLGGVMIWNIGTGYFPENRTSKRNPLLKTAWEALQ